ncbi:MAG TPA: HAD family hydrolase [Abditibacteriaceae bacterium]|nr:HAD family hydrolase [Abditibacteriaceae bacterium]
MELFVKQEIIQNLPNLDAILLDIDGVVLDVSQSFRVVASEVVQWYATNVLKIGGVETFFTPGETELFKNAGGFNNDWDLANAAVALLVAKNAEHPEMDTLALRQSVPDFIEYTNEIKRRGGGLAVAENIILDRLNPTQRRDFARNWNPKLVTQLFQEMYAGDQCRTLYGFAPEHIQDEGFLDKEPVLLDANVLPSKTKLGVLTGRTRAETLVALERSGLKSRVSLDHCVTDDDGVRKPDGRALALLQEKMKFRMGVYIGDTVDDLRVVQNFRETNAGGRARILSCIVLSGPAGASNRRMFLEAGAEIVAPDVNSVLAYLGSVLK